jgi:FkbM family methyltransferase
MDTAFHVRFLLKLLVKTKLIRYFNLYPKLRLGGRTINLPIIGGVGYDNLAGYEPWLDHVIKTLFDIREGSFVDVGVNLGQTLLKFVKYGDGRDYYGFEPNNLCFAYAEDLKNVNNLKNVNIFPVGLSDSDMLAQLFLRSGYDSAASMISGFRPPEQYSASKHIAVFKGDEIFENLIKGPVCILKVDVEGAELEVFAGLRNTIGRFRPFIICEILPVYEEESTIGKTRRDRTNRMLDLISVTSYKIFRLLHNGKAVSLDTIETHSDLELCEYLFVPEELSDAVNTRLRA